MSTEEKRTDHKQKTILGYDYSNNEHMKILLYLFIGGTAALVEWALFWWFDNSMNMNYLVATATAFLLATVYHYLLGNIFVFDSGARYKKGKEFSLVLLVSVVGLLLNLLLMYVFVSMLGLPAMLSKCVASCIVVVWNYGSRKKWIF